MRSFNKVILLGNLTRDPKIRYLPSGAVVASFGLAMNRAWNDKQTGERKEETCFVDISAFARTAEICGEYLQKGRSVLIEGHLRFSSWETDDGQKRNKLEVVADNIMLLPCTEDTKSTDTTEDDVPF